MAISQHKTKILLIGLTVLIVDFFTKFYTNQVVLPMGVGIRVFQNFLGVDFSIVHATNRGAAWGLFANYHIILLYFRIVLISLLSVYLFFFNKYPKRTVPLTLITAGALGNIIDYFLYGHVVDMFYFIFWSYDYPVFNVADSAICIGIFWLIIQSWFEKEHASSVESKNEHF